MLELELLQNRCDFFLFRLLFLLISWNKITTSTKRILPAVFVTLFLLTISTFTMIFFICFVLLLLLPFFFFPLPFICPAFWILLAHSGFDFFFLFVLCTFRFYAGVKVYTTGIGNIMFLLCIVRSFHGFVYEN